MKPEELLALTAAPILAALVGPMRMSQRETYEHEYRAQALRMAHALIADAERMQRTDPLP